MKRSVKELIPALSPQAWRVLGADAVSALGTGLVLPFLMVYMRDVRDIHVATAGLAVASMAFVSLAAGPLSGSIVDRWGSRKTLIVALIICGLGSISLAFIRQPWHAFVSTSFMGVGFAAMWPATHSLLTSVVDERHRSSVYAVHYATLNAGIGVGGIIGGLVANVSEPRTFELLYTLDSLSWFFFAAVLFTMKGIGKPHLAADGAPSKGGYGSIVRDKVFLRLMGVAAILVTVGYAQLESGFPAYVTGKGGASTRLLGMAFAANTFVIVFSQLLVLKWLEGKRRTRALMAICVLWAVAWSVTVVAGQIQVDVLKNLGFVLAMMVFAFGECMVSPSIPGILNDIASDELRGRYNAGYSLTFSIGHIIGPALAGFMLAADLGEAFFLGLVAVSLLTLYPIRALEKMIPDRANFVSTKDPGPEELPARPDVLTH